MVTIEDLIFRIPLGRSQFSTLFSNVAQSSVYLFKPLILDHKPKYTGDARAYPPVGNKSPMQYYNCVTSKFTKNGECNFAGFAAP
jgi:hypothetical protein